MGMGAFVMRLLMTHLESSRKKWEVLPVSAMAVLVAVVGLWVLVLVKSVGGPTVAAEKEKDNCSLS